ncbi:MAG: hypothetical protein MJ116_00280 [Lachnospiraceae bacterium]|nr:hypothetical protein [Lachnospiraceae bacterium]
MARLFKFIFHVLLIVYIAVVLALVVPPLVGYTTATVFDHTEGNQAVGTVDYAKRIPLQELNAGDKILVTGSNSVNVYTVQAVDTEKTTVTVADAESKEIPVRSYVYRMVLAAPIIGYVIIALQTMEGVIVLAMIAVLLILLCVLTSIWSKKAKEKRRRRKEAEARRAEADKRAAEQAALEEEVLQQSPETDRVLNARAEAYFKAREAEMNRPAPIEEYEDFPPKAQEEQLKKDTITAAPVAAPSQYSYFDDDEEDDADDSWLHDDVDEDDLFAGLSNKAATESLMATARLFAINRAAQLKEQMTSEEPAATANPTSVVPQEETAAVKTQPAVKETAIQNSVKEEKRTVKKTPVREIAVDKVINLKELKELDEDTEQIVLTINIKVVAE